MGLNGHESPADLELERRLQRGQTDDAIRFVHGHVSGLLERVEYHGENVEACREDIRDLRKDLARASRSSAHNLDAQALGQQIDNVDAKHTGNFEALKPTIARLEKLIGAAPNEDLKIEGSGLLGAMARFSQLRTVAIVAIGGAIVGASGASALVTWALHLGGGH